MLTVLTNVMCEMMLVVTARLMICFVDVVVEKNMFEAFFVLLL